MTILAIYFTVKNYNDRKNMKDCLTTDHCKLEMIMSPKLKEAFGKLKDFDQFVKPDDVSKIIVVTYRGGLGDEMVMRRIKAAAENLGWEAVIIKISPVKRDYPLSVKITQFLKPEFVISQHLINPFGDNIPNYLILHSPFDNTNAFHHKYLKFNGLLLSFGDDRFIKPLQDYFTLNNKTLNYEYFYYSVPKQQSQFYEVDYSKLLYSGARWDKRRGEDYSKLYDLLDQAGYFTI